MRILRLFVLFLTALVLCGPAHAAPIPGDYLQGQFAANPATHRFQITYELNRNASVETPSLFSTTEGDPQPIFGVNRTSVYLPEGSGTFNILTNTSAPLPEPPSLLLLGTGILALAVVWRLRRSKA